jgi:hypothetical protein
VFYVKDALKAAQRTARVGVSGEDYGIEDDAR